MRKPNRAIRLRYATRLAVFAAVLAAGLLPVAAAHAQANKLSPLSTVYVTYDPTLAFAQVAPDSVAETATLAPIDTTRHFWRAAGEITLLNVLVWSYNRYIRPGGGEGFRVTPETWLDNIKNGFEWDDNNFDTNHFAHPYHGNLYYNAARSNGYNYWQSIPFAFGGSFQWEYFGETHHPSINDWIYTSVGGTALGETLYRLSSTVLDNTATGSSRTWRELGGFLINPVRGFNRLVTGQATRVHANPKDRFPNHWGSSMDVGLRSVSTDRIGTNDTTKVYFEFEFEYGDPFIAPIKKPFQHFEFEIQVNFNDVTGLGRVDARGILGATEIKESKTTIHKLAAYQHYDYIYNRAYEFGAQSVSATFLSRVAHAGQAEFNSFLHANGVIMGAVKDDYPNFTGREYDYGPGLGFKFHGWLTYRGWDYLWLKHDQFWIHAINGNQVNHLVTMSSLKLQFPIHSFIGIGAEYVLQLRESNYQDYPDVSTRNPQVRAFFVWDLD